LQEEQLSCSVMLLWVIGLCVLAGHGEGLVMCLWEAYSEGKGLAMKGTGFGKLGV
jgi:hypothetical protein